MSLGTEFARLRLENSKHRLSVTADIAFESFHQIDPHAAAANISNSLFTVSYMGVPPGGLPTFNVTMNQVDPRDPELAMNTVKAHLEASYDDAGEELLR
jgi:hypothetical protein